MLVVVLQDSNGFAESIHLNNYGSLDWFDSNDLPVTQFLKILYN